MAEIAVNLLIDKLIPLLRYEVTLLRGVHSQVVSITDQLRLIRAYLKDADVKAEKAETSHAAKEWVKQVREVALRIEDVIDEYLLQVAERRQRRGFAGLIEKISRLLKSIEPRHGITTEIRDINNLMVNLDKKKETFGFNTSSSESSASTGARTLPYAGHDPRRAALFVDDAQLVGISDTTKLLKGLLKTEDLCRTVIAIVGTGGLGKTTVVRKLYDRQKEKGVFDCCAWITVSSSFKEKKIFRKMLQSFYEDEEDDEAKAKAAEKIDKASLIKKVRDYLQEKSYMLVFDDVWTEDFWGQIEFALPENNKRSRILITTRNKNVAEFCKSSARVHIHELQRLSSKDALSLFHQRAFQFKPEGCPQELQKLSEDIVKKCDGVPLAIVAIASLLSTKNNHISEWQKVHDSLSSKLGTDAHLKSFHRVLSESYHDLPCHLKPCLLYFGLFPDDYSISCTKLIRLWIAEGLVKVKENDKRSSEEVAEEYLNELMCRSLVIVSSEYFDGRPRSCRVHDLMHDFILEKCAELDFCQVIKSQDFNVSSTTRRLSIQFQTTNEGGDVLGKAADYGRVRFTLAFNFDEMPRPWVRSFLSSFKLLIGLDFEDAPLDNLPPAFGNLLHLKYLSLRNTRIKTLPKLIGKLQSLEYLDLKYTQVRELPIEINRLIKLRHLLAYSIDVETDYSLASIKGVQIKEGIGRLTILQKLTRVDMTGGGESLINELSRLKQLKRLGVSKLRRANGKMLCRAIEGMTHLESLSIRAADEREFLDLDSLTNPPPFQHLQRLYLLGRLGRLPAWLPRIPNVVRLVLNWSGLMEDPLLVLQDLSELLQLELYDAYEGDELHFREGWFKKLKVLHLEKMQALKTIKIDRGALPGLEKLTVGPFPHIVEVPHDIQNLDTLQLLRFYEMPLDPEDDKQSGIFRKIPFVIYSKDNKFYTLHNQDALNLMDS